MDVIIPVTVWVQTTYFSISALSVFIFWGPWNSAIGFYWQKVILCRSYLNQKLNYNHLMLTFNQFSIFDRTASAAIPTMWTSLDYLKPISICLYFDL